MRRLRALRARRRAQRRHDPAADAARSSPAPPTTSSLEPRHGDDLHARGILYAPDYAINAGGLINVAEELRSASYDRGRVLARVQNIAETLAEVFERSAREGAPTSEIADRLAEERVRKGREARAKRSTFEGQPPTRAVAVG